jgi:hypothetical protein
MKRLIPLIFSAVLLCPMWAGAQTVPNQSSMQTTVGALGTMKWIVEEGGCTEYTSLPVIVANLDNGVPIPFGSCLQNLYLNMLVPNNKSGIFPINGFLTAEGQIALPVSGTALTVTASGNPSSAYTNINLAINIGANLLSCSLYATSLSGYCTVNQAYSINKSGSFVITYLGIATE